MLVSAKLRNSFWFKVSLNTSKCTLALHDCICAEVLKLNLTACNKLHDVADFDAMEEDEDDDESEEECDLTELIRNPDKYSKQIKDIETKVRSGLTGPVGKAAGQVSTGGKKSSKGGNLPGEPSRTGTASKEAGKGAGKAKDQGMFQGDKKVSQSQGKTAKSGTITGKPGKKVVQSKGKQKGRQ